MSFAGDRVMNKYEGVLYAWFETGLEGLVWTLLEDDKEGYDALHEIENGDRLIIYLDGVSDGIGFEGSNGEFFTVKDGVLFDGIIDEDHEAGMTVSPFNPAHRQPSALGFWIHWTQKGWRPDSWASLFVRGESWGDWLPLRATLIKKPA